MDLWRLSHLVVESSSMILPSLWSLNTVKHHGSFLFASFHVQKEMKNLEKHLEICACPVAVCYFSIPIAVDQ